MMLQRMINMDKILDAPTAIAPTDIIYGNTNSNVIKVEILHALIVCGIETK